MTLDGFVTERQKALQQDLDAVELELSRLEQRRVYLIQAVSDLRVALNMLGECQAYTEGKHPQYPPTPEDKTCQNLNGAAPMSTALTSLTPPRE